MVRQAHHERPVGGASRPRRRSVAVRFFVRGMGFGAREATPLGTSRRAAGENVGGGKGCDHHYRQGDDLSDAQAAEGEIVTRPITADVGSPQEADAEAHGGVEEGPGEEDHAVALEEPPQDKEKQGKDEQVARYLVGSDRVLGQLRGHFQKNRLSNLVRSFYGSIQRLGKRNTIRSTRK